MITISFNSFVGFNWISLDDEIVKIRTFFIFSVFEGDVHKSTKNEIRRKMRIHTQTPKKRLSIDYINKVILHPCMYRILIAICHWNAWIAIMKNRAIKYVSWGSIIFKRLLLLLIVTMHQLEKPILFDYIRAIHLTCHFSCPFIYFFFSILFLFSFSCFCFSLPPSIFRHFSMSILFFSTIRVLYSAFDAQWIFK